MKFERIGFEQFKKDYIKRIDPSASSADIAKAYTKIRKPERSTVNSAGYDFVIPFDLTMSKNSMVYIPTGICIKLDPDKYLELVPRSSGAKKGLRLGNTVGVVDADYYNNPDNGGHILICMQTTDQNVSFSVGDKIAQGIIKQYFMVDDDAAKGVREGGFGSTGN